MHQVEDRSNVKPPECLRAIFKRWQRATTEEIEASSDIIGCSHGASDSRLRTITGHAIDRDRFQSRYDFADASQIEQRRDASQPTRSDKFYEVIDIPGLLIFPALLPLGIQRTLLDSMIHRDLSNPVHQTNLHFHHVLPYQALQHTTQKFCTGTSFFDLRPEQVLDPKDPTTHKPITVEQMLRRKLRWVTLGGQYDWTRKIYPDETPPEFPEEIAKILEGYFPDIDAQAAIVNFYTPGDTLSMHRDISEECDRGLISISIGCDGLFMVADEDGSQCAVLRLRSGDAVLMSGESRFAWHGVPKVMAVTCPTSLENWPHGPDNDRFLPWKGWLTSKRINLNVRQMKEADAMS